MVHGGSDLGGSSSLNLLVGDGGRLLEVEAWVDHDAVMDSWERLAAAMGLLARTHDLLRAVEAGEAGRRPRFANHLEPADVLAQARRGTARIRGWGPAAEEAGLADAADQLAERVAEAEAGLVPQLPRQLVHGDFWDDNVLFRNGRPVLLADFDFMGEGARVDDLALTLHHAGSDLGAGPRELPARLARLVGAYDRGLEVPLSEAERAALPLAMARQSLSSIGGWVARLDDEAAARRHAAGPGPRWRRRRGCWTTSAAGRTRSPGPASRRSSRPGWWCPAPSPGAAGRSRCRRGRCRAGRARPAGSGPP